jgi:TonB family protein
MKRNWLYAFAISLIVFAAESPQLFCQNDSTNEPQNADPVYKIGQGVKAPRALYQPIPEYDDKARKDKLEGTVVLELIVTKEGQTRDIKVTRSLSPGLDKKAIEAVSRWKFDPATKDGTPVAVKVNVETSFHLYPKN